MPTHLIRSLARVPAKAKGGVLSIGNFDGVHRGHQALIQAVQTKASALNAPSIILTFEPHPFEFFAGDALTIPRLTRFREKFSLLAANGVENIVVLAFNQQLAQLSAADFLLKIIEALKPRHVIVGDDFRFGFKRQGNFKLLSDFGRQYDFGTEALKTVLIENERVSSTRIRDALAVGDLERAQILLGRTYSMTGKVRRGDQRGRQLGFPTANIYLHRKLTPLKGVYTVYVHGVGPVPIPGVANIGVRPTVDGTRSLLEVHLLNFNEDIYGRHVMVSFCQKLRDEARYASLELLKEQITKDVKAAEHFFYKR